MSEGSESNYLQRTICHGPIHMEQAGLSSLQCLTQKIQNRNCSQSRTKSPTRYHGPNEKNNKYKNNINTNKNKKNS